eukprot:UN18774
MLLRNAGFRLVIYVVCLSGDVSKRKRKKRRHQNRQRANIKLWEQMIASQTK